MYVYVRYILRVCIYVRGRTERWIDARVTNEQEIASNMYFGEISSVFEQIRGVGVALKKNVREYQIRRLQLEM